MLKKTTGDYSCGDDWASYVVVDGKLSHRPEPGFLPRARPRLWYRPCSKAKVRNTQPWLGSLPRWGTPTSVTPHQLSINIRQSVLTFWRESQQVDVFMSNPKHTLFWMTFFLAVVAVVGVLIHQPLITAFMANWVFNLLILCVLIVGIGLTYRQVFVLFPELRWISQFRTGQSGLSVLEEPRLLKPLARQLGEDSKR